MLAIHRKRRPPAPPVGEPEGKGKRQVCAPTAAGKREYDRRRDELARRQRHRCAICQHLNANMEFDHQDGRGANGKHRDDRLLDEKGLWKNAALCSQCNGWKGSKRYMWHEGKYVPRLKNYLKETA